MLCQELSPRIRYQNIVRNHTATLPAIVSGSVAREVMEQATAMVVRFNRLFPRTLRQRRDLRRYAPRVTIQNAGQVNIGVRQVNAAALYTLQAVCETYEDGCLTAALTRCAAA